MEKTTQVVRSDLENNKTYKSKMHLKGNDLDVKVCVSIFCSGQDWKRVKSKAISSKMASKPNSSFKVKPENQFTLSQGAHYLLSYSFI